MTVYYRGEVWRDIEPNLPEFQEVISEQLWDACGRLFGENGDPGMCHRRITMTMPSIFGRLEPVSADWVLCRSELGRIVGFVVFFRTNHARSGDEFTKAIFGVRPGWEKLGVGTKLVDFALDGWGEENDYDIRKQDYSPAGAAFINSYVARKFGCPSDQVEGSRIDP